MKRTILLIAVALISYITFGQRILSKQQERYGSCSVIYSAEVNFNDQNITVLINTFKDNDAYLNKEGRTNLMQIKIPLIINPLDTLIGWLKQNDERFFGANIIEVESLTINKDTLWVDIPSRQSDTSIHRKVGVYSMPIDFETKSCNIKAVAKHLQNSNEILTEHVQWTVERSDSFYYSGSKLPLFDFMNDLMKAGDYSREKRLEVLGYGLNIFYPISINDRITD